MYANLQKKRAEISQRGQCDESDDSGQNQFEPHRLHGAVTCTAEGGSRYSATRKASAAPEIRAMTASSATRKANLMAAMLARTDGAFPSSG